MTSVRRMKKLLSDSVCTQPSATGVVKLGQPVPESNLSAASNSSLPHATQR